MANTLIGEFCKNTPNWREILSAEPYNIKISEDGPYIIFKYNQLTSDFANPIVREARGIIFERSNWEKPVCWPFMKFFNWGESNAAELDWSTAFVSEKVDGSLIKVWYHDGWHLSTNGTIDAYKADLANIKYSSFGEYFEDVISAYYGSLSNFTKNLDMESTYMFELVGPYNRVVVPYEESKIYFLGVRDNYTGTEQFGTTTTAGYYGLGFDIIDTPMQYPLTSLDDCINLVGTFDWEREGFVAADAKGNRVKIKSPAYVKAHFARNNCVITRKHLINIVLQNEIAEFLCYASDFEDELWACQKLINTYYRLGNSLAATVRRARNMSRGDFAGLVKTFPKIFQDLLFKNYDRDLSTEDYTVGWRENRWEDCLVELEKLKNEWFEN